MSSLSEDIGKRVPVSAVRDRETGDLILKLVNILPANTQAQVRLNGVEVGYRLCQVGTQTVRTVLKCFLREKGDHV